jgi:hypothetical protein
MQWRARPRRGNVGGWLRRVVSARYVQKPAWVLSILAPSRRASNEYDFLWLLAVDRLRAPVNPGTSPAATDATQAKQNELMLLQRARDDLAHARKQLAQLMRAQPSTGRA